MSTVERREALLRWLQANAFASQGQVTSTIAFHFQGGAHHVSLIRSDLQALERRGLVERNQYLNGPIRWRIPARQEAEHD